MQYISLLNYVPKPIILYSDDFIFLCHYDPSAFFFFKASITPAKFAVIFLTDFGVEF